MKIPFLAIAFLCLVSVTARAAEGPPPLPAVKTVETYLNKITTLKSRFSQTANDGQTVKGTFWLKRPGKMRFEYDPPVTDFIVADGWFVYYYDGQMEQQSNVPIGQSLADFFLREDLKLSGDVNVTGMKRQGGLLHLTLTQAKDPLAGTLTLMLKESPLQLKKWRIVDAQGLVTEVELFDVTTGIAFNKDLFHYYDPKRKNPAYGRN